MLKKAGIVVAAIAATLLVASPLAYAGGSGPEGGGGSEQDFDPDEDGQLGLVNLNDINALNGVNVCPDVTAVLGLGNVLGILGLGGTNPVAADAPVTCANEVTDNDD